MDNDQNNNNDEAKPTSGRCCWRLCCFSRQNAVAASVSDTPIIVMTPEITPKKMVEAPRTILVSSTPVNHVTTPPAALFLPSIHSPDKPRSTEKPSRQQDSLPTVVDKPRFVEPSPSSATSNLSAVNHQVGNGAPSARIVESASSARPPLITREEIIPLPQSGKLDFQDKLFQRPRRSSRDFNSDGRVCMTSAPAVISTRESSSSSSTNDCHLSHTTFKPPLQGPLEVSSTLSYCSLNESYNQKVKAKRKALNTGGKVPTNARQFPDSLKPFDRPREGLDTCFSQLDAQQWEVTIQGLTSMVRLLRHHPATAAAHVHSLSGALARHIRNLRSQVARAACQASVEMFGSLKKSMEPELEEVVGALFHRAADTNRFIRADSNSALDAMVDSVTPVKSILVVVAKGAGHQNAVARTAAARLLVRLSERLGPEKILNLPKDARDRMLHAGAGLLMEGRLETRAFAKQMFRLWSSNADLSSVIMETIPANVMRHISKTLASLRP